MLFGGSVLSTTFTVSVSLLAVLAVLGAAYLLGDRLSAIALSQSSEALLLTLLGGTLLVAGIAGRLNLSTAVGAFVVGVALSGDIVSHARGLLLPLRNLFAAAFFETLRACKWTCNSSPMSPSPRSSSRVGRHQRHQDRHRLDRSRTSRHRQTSAGRVREPRSSPTESSRLSSLELGISRESGLGALAATYVIILSLAGDSPLPVLRRHNPPHPEQAPTPLLAADLSCV